MNGNLPQLNGRRNPSHLVSESPGGKDLWVGFLPFIREDWERITAISPGLGSEPFSGTAPEALHDATSGFPGEKRTAIPFELVAFQGKKEEPFPPKRLERVESTAQLGPKH